ncbi:MAG: TonB-dependent receptor [Lewinellaceae bacterium]|nr:TonB-dependent receptor [Lewinellaceae bacterium]
MAKRILATLLIVHFGVLCPALAQESPQFRPVDFSCANCLPADALVRLSRQTGISIAFNTAFFQDCPPISISATREPFGVVLDKIADCARLSYKWGNEQVVLYRKNFKYTLSGYVKDAETGERLIGATIRVLSGTSAGAISNEFGFFSLSVEPGAYRIAATYIGYRQEVRIVEADADRMLTFSLQASSALPEVVVTALPATETGSGSSNTSGQNLPPTSMRNIPMPGGEADLLRLMAQQPGVQSGVDGLGGLHVRGGNADQNLILLDDVPVYNPSHALGLFSVFNPATISHARLWKGDFPARYSGRTASVLDVRTRDGNLREYHGEVSAGLFAASATLEGPLKRDTAAFLLSGRTTYFGPWTNLFSKRDNLLTFSGDNVAYRFYDLNLKLNYAFSARNRLHFSYYQGGDAFRNQFVQRFDNLEGVLTDQYGLSSEWGNAIAALRWNLVLHKKLFTNTTLRFSRFFYQSRLTLLSNFLTATGKESLLANYGQFYQTLIQDWSGKTDLTYYPTNRLTVRWGMSYTLHSFQPGALSVNFLVPGQSPLALDSLSKVLLNNERLGADQAELYAEADWRFWRNWRMEAGVNVSSFQIRNSVFRIPQPRFRLQNNGPRGWRTWVGYHRTAQFLHQIGSFNISLPFELWVPTTALVPPELAWQVSGGIGLRRSGWNVQLEGYHKRLDRVLTFLSSSTALFAGGAEDASGWEDRIIAGTGTASGLEFMLEKRTRTTAVGLVYTWSVAERHFPDLNSGRPFPFRFDRRHDVKITVQQQLFKWLDANMIWTYATGNAITLAGVKYQHHTPNGDIERNVFVYTDVNGYRLPALHRLDMALNAHFGKKRLQHELQFGVYNAYNRANPFFLYVDGTGSDGKAKAVQYTLLPLLPTFRYAVKF